jgi:hypothetical protein
MSDENKLKLKYDQFSNPKNKEDGGGDDENIILHKADAPVRNICFILKDGIRIFLSYAYLLSAEFLSEENTIILTFTTHTVTLKGYFLESLFEALENHAPKRISIQEERYVTLEKDQTYVTEIQINDK